MEADQFIEPGSEQHNERAIKRILMRELNERKAIDFAFEEFDVDLDANVTTEVGHRLGQVPGSINIIPMGAATVYMPEEPDEGNISLRASAAVTVRVRVTK